MDSVNHRVGFAKLAWLHNLLRGFRLLVSGPFCSSAWLKAEWRRRLPAATARGDGRTASPGWQLPPDGQLAVFQQTFGHSKWDLLHAYAGTSLPEHPDVKAPAAAPRLRAFPLLPACFIPAVLKDFFLVSAPFAIICSQRDLKVLPEDLWAAGGHGEVPREHGMPTPGWPGRGNRPLSSGRCTHPSRGASTLLPPPQGDPRC